VLKHHHHKTTIAQSRLEYNELILGVVLSFIHHGNPKNRGEEFWKNMVFPGGGVIVDCDYGRLWISKNMDNKNNSTTVIVTGTSV
jgi:hypothetical protein